MGSELKFRLALDNAERVKTELSGVEAQFDRIAGAVSRVGHYGAGFLLLDQGLAPMIGSAVRAADTVTTLTNTLKLATGSAQAAAHAYEALFDIAQRSRVGFAELAGTYASVSRAGQEIGISQQRLLTVTEAIGNAMTISGGSAQGMQAALTQLGQGLASGTLRGEELNSVMEQAPRLAKALADGLGVPIGRLREMGAAGEISAQQVISALESQSKVLSGEVTGATLAVSQAFTTLQNAAVKAVGDFDSATGSSAKLAGAIGTLADGVAAFGRTVRENETAVAVVTGSLASAAVVAGISAVAGAVVRVTGAVSLLGAALTANPLTLALLGVGATVGGGVAVLRAQSRTVEGIGRAIDQLEQENRRSEEALKVAMGGGRAAGAANIQSAIDGRRKAIAELRGELAQLQTVGTDNRAEEARFARGTQAYRDQQAAAATLAGIRRELSGVDKDYLPTLEKLYRLYTDGNISQKEYVALVADLASKNFKKAASHTASADAYAAERDAAKAWSDVIKAADSATLAATASTDGLGKAQSLLLQYLQSPAYGINTEAMRQAALAHLYAAVTAEQHGEAQKKASEQQAEAQRAVAEAVREAQKAHESLIAVHEKSAEAAEKNVAALVAEEEAAELAKGTRYSLAQAIHAVTIARLREQQVALLGNEDAVLLIEREISAREQLIELIGSKQARDAHEKAAKDSADALQKSYEDVSKSLADALMRGGKSGREYIKGLLRQPFNIVLQATVQSVAGSVPGLFGMPSAVGGVGGAGMGGMAAMSMAGNPFAMGFSGAWGAGGGLMSTIGAGTSLIGSGQIGAGLGVWAGAAMPILAGLSMLASLDDSGTLHTGAAASSDGTRAKRIEAPSIGTQGIVVSADTQQTVNQLAVGGAGVLNTTARNFGKAGGYSMSTAYADDSSADGAWGAMVIERGGSVRQDWRNGQTSRWAPREFSDGAAGRQEYEQALAQGLRQELLAMDLPGWATDMLNELGDTPGMQELLETVGQINDLQATFGALGQSLVEFASMGDAALLKLVSASGGSANLLAQVSSYEAKYYTQAERRASLEQKVQGELAKVNLQMPTTRQEYRAMMDAAIDMGEAGVQTQAVLLANADAFAELTPEIEEATEAVKRSAADIARERDSLQRRYLQLIGDQTALRELDLAALDESNRALQRQIWAEEDRQAALAEATRAQDEYNRSLASAQSWLAGVTRSIREFVRGGLGSNEPQSSVSPALAAYREQYRLAASGDRDALQNITAAAQKVVSAAEQRMGSTQARQLIAQLGGELLALPGMVSAEQFIADSVTTAGAQTTGAVQALPAQLDTLIGGRLAAGFAMIDANADEQVSRSEFMTAFGALGTESTLGAIFSKLDTNGDGQISRLEAVDGKLGRSNQELGWLRGDLAHMANIAAESWHVQAAIRGDLAHIANLMNAGLTVRSEFRAGSMQTFATGGAFGAGGVVRRPTAFSIGLMGEAGPEAILPLTSIGGTLGVRAIGGAGSNDRLERLLRELVTETTRQGYELRAVATSNNAIALRMREFELRGMMVRPTPDEPLAVGVVA